MRWDSHLQTENQNFVYIYDSEIFRITPPHPSLEIWIYQVMPPHIIELPGKEERFK
jgi:hypothetical protein